MTNKPFLKFYKIKPKDGRPIYACEAVGRRSRRRARSPELHADETRRNSRSFLYIRKIDCNMDSRRQLHFTIMLFGEIEIQKLRLLELYYLNGKLKLSPFHERNSTRSISSLLAWQIHCAVAFTGSFRYQAIKYIIFHLRRLNFSNKKI